MIWQDWYRVIQDRIGWGGVHPGKEALTAIAKAYAEIDTLKLRLSVAEEERDRANARACEMARRVAERFEEALAHANEQIENQSGVIRSLLAALGRGAARPN